MCSQVQHHGERICVAQVQHHGQSQGTLRIARQSLLGVRTISALLLYFNTLNNEMCNSLAFKVNHLHCLDIDCFSVLSLVLV